MSAVKEKKEMQALINTISKRVDRFNKREIECLIQHFYQLVWEQTNFGGATHCLERGSFRCVMHRVFGLTDDMIMEGSMLDADKTKDTRAKLYKLGVRYLRKNPDSMQFTTFDEDNDGYITAEEWIAGLSVFLRGTLDEKTRFCFHVYDLNGDKYISREEIFHMLKNSIVRHPAEEDPDEGIKDLVDITFKKMDKDLDGRLSFEDFEKSVKEENLLLEAFGTCFPDPNTTEMFEQHVFQKQIL